MSDGSAGPNSHTRPVARVKRDWRGRWGVQVKWPRHPSDLWAKHQLIPRFVWHGPFGLHATRWPTREQAEQFADLFREKVARIAALANLP